MVVNHVQEMVELKKKKAKIVLKSPTQERSRNTVATILEACSRILVRDGYFGVTTDKIAKEAGVSIGSLYQFFGNKESVVSAVIQNMMEQDIAQFKSCMVNIAALPLEQRIRAMIQLGLDVYRNNQELRSKVQTIQLYLTDQKFFEDSMRFYENLIADNLPQIQGRDRNRIAYVCVSAFNGLLNRAAIENKHFEDDILVDEIVKLFEGYLSK